MIARVLLLIGLALFLFDVARLTMTGIAVLGVVLMVIAFWLAGAFTREFWIADDEASKRYCEIDAALDRLTPAGGGAPTQMTTLDVTSSPAGPTEADR